MKKNKVLLILFIVLAATIVAQYTLFKDDKSEFRGKNGKVEQRDSSIKAGSEVTLDFGNGRKITQTLKADTAYEALEAVAAQKGYKINYKQYKYGLIVEEINRVKNTSEKSWIYSVNGNTGMIAADRYKLSPGDIVEWKYTSVK